MQDFDLYVRKNTPFIYPQGISDSPEPEYFSRLADSVKHDEKHSRRKANSTLALVGIVGIAAFTAGLVVGIKFAGGPDRAIVDPHTRRAVTELGSTMSSMIRKDPSSREAASAFPREEYPFVVGVGGSLTETDSKALAEDLSRKGHTVIVSRQNEGFRLFVGPFKSTQLAENSLQKIRAYPEHSLYREAVVLKRM